MEGMEHRQRGGYAAEETVRVFFTLSHIATLCRRSWKSLSFVILFFTLLTSYVALTRPLQYSVQATLQDQAGGRHSVSVSGGELAYFQEGRSRFSEVRSPIALLLSRRILVPLVEELSLHVVVKEQPRSFWEKLTGWLVRKERVVSNNLRVEWARMMGRPRAEIVETEVPLQIKDLALKQSGPLKIEVDFLTDDHYRVFNSGGTILGEGSLGKSFSTNSGLRFTMDGEGVSLAGRRFHVAFHPSTEVAADLARELRITQSGHDKSLYTLSYTGPRRRLAAQVLNKLMEHYGVYLKAEASERVKTKLSYLHERQSELLQAMEGFIASEQPSVRKGLSGEQYLDYERQAELFSHRQNDIMDKISTLRMHQESLQKFSSEGTSLFAMARTEMPEIAGMVDRLRLLREKRDRLDLDLEGREEMVLLMPKQIEGEILELDRMDRKVRDLKLLLASLQSPKRPAASLVTEATALPVTKVKPEPLLDYLGRAHRRYQMKSRVMRSRLLFQQGEAIELRGLNMEAADKLYGETSGKLDRLQKELESQSYLLQNLSNPDYPLGALSGQLDDPVSTELIRQAAEIQERVDNEAFYTDREIHYFEAFLERKTKAIKGHLQQKIGQLEKSVVTFEGRLQALQEHMLSLTHQRMAVLEQQIEESIAGKEQALEVEKNLLESELADVEASLAELPAKRAAERELKIRSDLHAKITQAISEMVEAIQISEQMQAVNATPLDPAVPSAFPDNPRLVKFVFLGIVLGLAMSMGFLVCSELIRGLRMTPEALRAFGGHVGGEINDRDAMRRSLAALGHSQEGSTLLVAGAGASCADEVARLMAMRGQKAVVVELPTTGEEAVTLEKGLLAHLKGEVRRPQVMDHNGIARLPAGGTSPYAVELIGSEPFSVLIKKLGERYDWIVLESSAPLDSVEVDALLSYASHCLITLKQTPCRLVQPYLAHELPTSFLFVGG